MKVRLRFSKTGALVYIGHLDVMRYFQKLFRRAKIPVAYSEGFSPHQILSFSPPLPLGMESTGEYADVEITERITSTEALRRLGEQSVDEIVIATFKELPEKCANAMASVNAASYTIYTGENEYSHMKEGIAELLSQESVLAVKKSKKSTKEIDIRPLIYELYADDEELAVNMLISSGSTDNLKPELVIDSLAGVCGYEFDTTALLIKRTDQYTYLNNKLVSLDEIGKIIT